MTKINKACEAYKIFDAFKITENMNISDYILEFDKPYNKAKKYEMALPEAILAFKILDNAGLSSQEKQLDLTACTDLQYKSMKSALQRIFGEKSSSYSDVKTDSQIITVKQEPGFCTQNKKINSKQRGTNPLNKFGKRTKCIICQSVFHWAKDCPEKRNAVQMTECDPDEVEDCNVTLLTKEVPSTNEKNSSLVQKRNTLEIRKMFNNGRQMESRNGCSNTKKGKLNFRETSWKNKEMHDEKMQIMSFILLFMTGLRFIIGF